MGSDMDAAFDRIEQLMSFPAVVPIKVMGERDERFAGAIAALVRGHVADFDPESLTETLSRRGNFSSLTVKVRVESRAQLQTLYEALAAHEKVRIVI